MSDEKPDSSVPNNGANSDGEKTTPANIKAEPRVVSEPVVQAKPKAKHKEKSSSGGFVKFLLFICLLIALAAAGLSAWLYRELVFLPAQVAIVEQNQDAAREQQYQQLSEGLLNQGVKLDGVQQIISSQRESVAQLRQNMDESLAALIRQQQDMEASLAQLSSVDRNDWMLAEVEFLLRLATQRAQLNRDARAAAKLLSSADQILLELDDPALHSVRAALADEIAALQAVAQFDVEGVYLKLQSLSDSAEALRLYRAPEFIAEESAVNDTDADWKANLQAGVSKAWQKLNSYIRIRHHDEDFKPNLAPEQEWALRASLRMMLEQAQLALLSERQAVFAQSLTKASETVERFYLLDERRNAVLAELTELSALNVERRLPDVGGALTTFKAYQSSRRWQREAGQ
ncbi:uroporphyrinogen-III C-methyltransferase [Spongiibacter sp. KMU-158]|uniref:Uroporphyrinogen-III C-methyltransferase n=1 Tax=Spongiibacter pelagi TaxID=2760804 RepID=A0A927GVX2_9GAMM|nr:uroporphyrinogen-III C-methyltransferase [Spongiibacter pelagi]MBD2857824.1 uroporphyrinogen-III C-methyltransferase [Spongiibacter pelagi]